MRTSKATSVLALSFIWFLMLSFSSLAQAANHNPGVENPRVEVQAAIHHDVSPALRDIPNRMPELDAVPHEHPVKRWPHTPVTSPSDGALQTINIGAFNATLGASFDGVGIPNYAVNAAPPDTEGSVGATQYVQWVNEAFAVFEKSTGSMLKGPTAGNALWAGFGGGCQNNNDGDPIVLWDKAAQRWIFMQFSVSTTPYLQCVAVSTTSDATGSYNRYSFSFGTGFNDYPKLGVWPDAYYTTYNIFNNGSTFAGAKLCAWDRTAMLAGTVATQQCFQLSTSFGGVLPADLDGSTAPPAGSPNYMVNFGSNVLNVWKFHVDFTNPANTTLTGPTALAVASFTEACGGGTCVPQPSTNNKLDSLGDRVMYRLAYRNRSGVESLVVNHSVKTGGSKRAEQDGVRWYEIGISNQSPSIRQQGTFHPDANSRWMGSMAMDKVGDIAVGYSVSSGSVIPSIRFTGRVPTDPLGTLETEVNEFNGSGSQTGTLHRWGDYSSLSVDPADDCTFWYTQEYLKSNGSFNWSTRIASFKFPSCI
jgi:hypothetical protein